MTDSKAPQIFELASDDNPIFVSVDYGTGGDITTECEVEMLPDGKVLVKDIRQTPEPPKGEA